VRAPKGAKPHTRPYSHEDKNDRSGDMM